MLASNPALTLGIGVTVQHKKKLQKSVEKGNELHSVSKHDEKTVKIQGGNKKIKKNMKTE